MYLGRDGEVLVTVGVLVVVSVLIAVDVLVAVDVPLRCLCEFEYGGIEVALEGWVSVRVIVRMQSGWCM